MNLPRILLTNKKRGWSGESAMIAELASGLANRGYCVTLATNPNATIINRVADAAVEILPLTLLKDMPQVLWTLPMDMRRLAVYLREQNVKLVHTNASFDTWTAALAIKCYRIDVPLIRTKHNVKRIRTSFTNRWYYREAIKHLVAPSRAVEKDLRTCGIVQEEKINYIPYGLAIEKIQNYRKSKAEARAELGIPADAEVVAYISRISRRKDPATLVKAALQVAKKRPLMRLLIVGGGDNTLKAELMRIAAGNSMVEFWGHRDDVPRILAAIDVFVLPSITEAFGLAPLEAMLKGVATIVSDAEGFRDFVQDGVNGIVFPHGDVSALARAVELVLSDQNLRRKLSEAGERTVHEHFYVDRMVSNIENLYHRVLNDS